MNKDNAIRKINSIGKAGSIISKICIVALTIGVVVSVIFGILFLTVPKEDFAIKLDEKATCTVNMGSEMVTSLFGIKSADMTDRFTEGSVNVNGINYSFTDVSYDESSKLATYQLEGDGATVTAGRFAVVLFVGAAFAAVNLILFLFVKKLCEALKNCRSPFEEEIISGIQRCAWVLIPWTVLGGSFQNVLSTAFTNTIQTGFSVDLATVLVILLLFGLAYVFKYGAVLQTESDETL